MSDNQCERCGEANPAEIHTCTPKKVKHMKPAVWRIFQNNRWSYSNTPSTRHEDRPAWQPLYAVPEKEWVGLTDEERVQCELNAKNNYFEFARTIEAKLKEKNA